MKNKNPMEILRKEHDAVLKVLDALEAGIRKKDKASSQKSIKLLEKEFNKHSLDKEEKALFPEIEKFMPREGGPTGMMVMEHEDLVDSIKRFNEELKSGNADRTGMHIIDLLRQHIGKENNILFMMAEMHLDERHKETILKKFERIDRK